MYEQNIEEIKNDVPLFNIECEQLQNTVRRKGTKLLEVLLKAVDKDS